MAMPENWAEMEAKYKRDIEMLTESAEMATIEKEIAEEKLDSCEKELEDIKSKLAAAMSQVETMQGEQQAGQSMSVSGSEATVTTYQLQKVEEQNELMKQALVRLRDISTNDKRIIEELENNLDDLQGKVLDLSEKEQKFLDQIKIYEEQIDANQSAQEMVEKLSQQKTELEDKIREMVDELECMNKLRDLDEQLVQTARETEIDLTNENDLLRAQVAELNKRRRDLEDYLSEQERAATKLKEDNRQLMDQISLLRDRFKEGESIEQQKHQIENVAYKLNFSETKMAEKEAEIARYKRNLAEMEEQMNNLCTITKEQSARIDELKLQADTKNSENAELLRAIKKKIEEVSEQEIRREMAEKKLSSLQRESETKLSNLNRTIETMKGIEVQHEEAIKRLMEDNDLIEKERRDLKDQLNKSNRSLERSMQTGNLSASMVTAQDTSLASLGISLHASSPASNQQAGYSPQLFQHQHLPNQSPSTQPIQASHLDPLGSAPGLARNISLGADASDSVFMAKLKDLSSAFDQVNRKNYELELELAMRELNKGAPPSASGVISEQYDMNRICSLKGELQKLKREVRLRVINQKICPKLRGISSLIRSENFENSKLSMRYQMLENEATALMSSSSLARMLPANKMTLLQSTPVK